jgi:hypothetical protein
MPTKQVTDLHNFGVRDAMMQAELYRQLMFYGISGQITSEMRSNTGLLSNTDQIVFPANAIVHRLDGASFVSEGTDFVQMPMKRRLVQPDKRGNQDLVGTGETIRHLFSRAYINETNWTVNLKKGVMDKLRTDKWERYYDLAEPMIMELGKERMNAEFLAAFYEGYSQNVSEGLNESPDGIGVKIKWHPNMYAWDPGTVAGDLTVVGVEGNNKTSAQVTAGITGTLAVPTAATLYSIAERCTARKIEKGIVVDGQPYWLAVINLRTWHNLMQDATIRPDMRAVESGNSYNNVFFAKKLYRWGDFIFLVDEVAARSWDNTIAASPAGAGTFASHAFDDTGLLALGYHGDPNAGLPYPNTTINIYGQGSLGFADVIPFYTEIEEFNFRKQKELMLSKVYGICRNEFVAKAIEPTVYAVGQANKAVLAANPILNQSSMVVFVAR